MRSFMPVPEIQRREPLEGIKFRENPGLTELNFHPKASVWFKPMTTRTGIEDRAPRSTSVLPRDLGPGPRFVVFGARSGQRYFEFEAPDWYSARDEADRLARAMGVKPGFLAVRGVKEEGPVGAPVSTFQRPSRAEIRARLLTGG